MSTETKAVETKTETAASQSETVVTPTTTEVDYEAQLAAKDAEIAQVRTEKDNYRKGLLKAKGKLPDEEDNSSNGDESEDARIARIVKEQLLSTREAQVIAEKEVLVQELAKKNKELTLALKNRGQVSSTTGQGSNEDRAEVKTDRVLSPEQLNALKARGFNDKMIEDFKKNLNKGNEMPK